MTNREISVANVVVVGSTNTDLIVSVPQLPRPGETVLGSHLRQVGGGKGANQAVAAARLGGRVSFVGRVGDDDYGKQTRENLAGYGIDLQHLLVTPEVASGVALISIDSHSGENSIVVAPGANSCVSPADMDATLATIERATVVVVSLEIPLATVAAAVEMGRRCHLTVIVNPAPAQRLPTELLSQIDVLTPNEQELEVLGGAEYLLRSGVKHIVTTLGARGVLWHTTTQENDSRHQHFPAPQVTAVDTVAAGDCFTGALAAELARGQPLTAAISFAVSAASLKVTRTGVQSAIPSTAELNAWIASGCPPTG